MDSHSYEDAASQVALVSDLRSQSADLSAAKTSVEKALALQHSKNEQLNSELGSRNTAASDLVLEHSARKDEIRDLRADIQRRLEEEASQVLQIICIWSREYLRTSYFVYVSCLPRSNKCLD